MHEPLPWHVGWNRDQAPRGFSPFGTVSMHTRLGRLDPRNGGIGMRTLAFLAAAAAGLCGAALWWRNNRRAGAEFVNRGSSIGVSSAAHMVSSV